MESEMMKTTKMKCGKVWKYEKETYETRKNDIQERGNVEKWYTYKWNVDKWINEKVKMRNEKVINE